MEQCTTCGRKLKDKKSIDRGYGPVCYQKHLKALEDEKNQVTIDEVIEEDAVWRLISMCKTCNGTGGENIEHGNWGVSFHPCPDSHCNFDREKAWKETELAMKRLLESLEERESA